MNQTLQKIFYPESILIAGASSKKGSIGYELTSCILKYGFNGKLFLVNPSVGEILGNKCYSNISELPSAADLAIILVPKQFAENSIDECLSIGIRSFILITAGFKETGADGEAAEKRIVNKILSAGGRIVGPNCMGVINTLDNIKLNATFVAEHPEKGSTAFLSQSGALGAAVLNSLRETGIKFAHFISVGNKADISENDLIQFWSEDPNISVITLYLESFADGKKFLDIVSNDALTKPVVILKAGKTEGGMKAASSHTGALGANDLSVNAIVEQFGLIRVDNLNELFNTAKGFENFPFPGGKRIAIVTNAGGPAILAVDSLEKNNLTLAVLSEETKKQLKNIVHPEGSVNNPIDLLPGGTAEMFKKVTEILLAEPEVDSVIVIFVEPVMVKPMDVICGINNIVSEKPVFPVVMPLPEFWSVYKNEQPSGRPLFRNPEDPAVIIKNMISYSGRKKNVLRLKKQYPDKNNLSLPENGFLSHYHIKYFAEKYSLPLVENKTFSFDELKTVQSGFPYVLKAGGEGIIHKTELKGVELNIGNNKDLMTAASGMQERFVTSGGYKLEYFNLQPFIKTKFELLIGGFRDRDFGPMVMFGTGGKYVEYYKDINIKSAFLSENDLNDMLSGTVMGKLLYGVRGEAASNVELIKGLIKSTAQILLDYEKISEIDLNPAIVSENNELLIVDIRIKI
jgi:acetate---CoA ligase (ADP-forming)